MVKLFEYFYTDIYLAQWLFTVGTVVVVLLLRLVIRNRLLKIARKHNYKPHRVILMRRTIFFIIHFIALIILITIWGLEVENLWIYFSSVFGLIAIGFFATWSILSNMVAGLMIYLSNPFRIDSKIKLYDHELEATVLTIGLFYTQLRDDEGIFEVPNSIFFQKIFKVLDHEVTI